MRTFENPQDLPPHYEKGIFHEADHCISLEPNFLARSKCRKKKLKNCEFIFIYLLFLLFSSEKYVDQICISRLDMILKLALKIDLETLVR